MDKTEIRSRLESLRWYDEEEKSLAELLAWVTRLKAKEPILRSCQSIDKCITYIEQEKEACQQSRGKCMRLLDLATDDAARKVLYVRYEQGYTAERTAELLCYSLSNVFKLQRKGITEISAALTAASAPPGGKIIAMGKEKAGDCCPGFCVMDTWKR